MNPKTFLYQKHEGIATITLNRPERLNAISFEAYREMTDFFAALRDERDVRVVVITGTRRAICSGGGVRDLICESTARGSGGLSSFTLLSCELIHHMLALPYPIIASL